MSERRRWPGGPMFVLAVIATGTAAPRASAFDAAQLGIFRRGDGRAARGEGRVHLRRPAPGRPASSGQAPARSPAPDYGLADPAVAGDLNRAQGERRPDASALVEAGDSDIAIDVALLDARRTLAVAWSELHDTERWIDEVSRRGSIAHDRGPAAEPIERPAPSAPAPAVTGEAGAQAAGVDETPVPDVGNRPPVYPPSSRRRGESGTVYVRAVPGADGRVQEATLASSSGFGDLDRAAVEAVSSWRFAPARSGGVGVASEARVPVRFVLKR